MVILPESRDVGSTLDALVSEQTIATWAEDPMLKFATTDGSYVSECPLSRLAVRPSDDAIDKARRFWNGAIAHDGSMSDVTLSVMRMDDGRQSSYIRRYKDIDRYVEETCSLHADAVLLPDGTFISNDGLRGVNQLHDWNMLFSDTFVRPLMPVSASATDTLVARMFSYVPARPGRSR